MVQDVSYNNLFKLNPLNSVDIFKKDNHILVFEGCGDVIISIIIKMSRKIQFLDPLEPLTNCSFIKRICPTQLKKK